MKSAAAKTARDTFDESTEQHELLERCRKLVERAVRGGAHEAEVFGTHSRSVSVRFEKGDLKLTQVDDGSALGLRCFQDTRLGFSSTNQSDDRSLARTAQDALTLCGFAPPDAFNRLPAARPIVRRASLVEPALANCGVDEAVELGREFLARIQRIDKRLSVDNAACDIARVTHAIHASTGTSAVESDAQISLNVFGMAIDGDDVGGFHYTGDNLRRLADVESATERLIEEFARVALGNLGARAAESYAGPVLFAPDALLDLFVAPIVSAASAIAVQRGRSPLAGKIGAEIAASNFDVHDDPTDRTLSGAGDFDREGQPTDRFALVERGVLKSYLYNGYAAAVEGRTSTGHASGGSRSTPGLGVHSLVVAPGDGGTRNDMFARLGRGLYVQRFSGTIDPASGDFSGVAKSARWIERGECVRSLRETLISGNAFALLKSIVSLSTEVERCMGAASAPFALVDGVSVTAG